MILKLYTLETLIPKVILIYTNKLLEKTMKISINNFKRQNYVSFVVTGGEYRDNISFENYYNLAGEKSIIDFLKIGLFHLVQTVLGRKLRNNLHRKNVWNYWD